MSGRSSIPARITILRNAVAAILASTSSRAGEWIFSGSCGTPQPPLSEKPFRDELLSIERLEERALALAASFTVDPNPRRRARNIFPRFDDNARVLRDAYRTLADDVRTGQFVTAAAEWLLDNFHLVTLGDPGHPPAPARHLLPAAADARLARAGRPHAHLRHGRRAGAPQRQPDRSAAARRVRQQLPARRAADDRRALGVAEHAEAGAHRKPQASGRGDAGSRARARLAADAYVARIERDADDTAQPLPPPPRHRLRRPAAASGSRVRSCGCRRSARRSRSTSRRRRRRRKRRFAANTSGRRPTRCRWPMRSPACACARARLAPVRRVGEPGRAGAAARSRRRVRADGLPQPRSAAPGGRGARARRAATRRCGSR